MKRLILGIGNLLKGDDGVGVHVARALKMEEEYLGVDIEDGGTGGLSLIDFFDSYEEILVVDAAGLGLPPGEFRWIAPDMLCARRAWSGHDHGLVDAIRLLEVLPAKKTIRILGVQPAQMESGTTLGPELRAAFSTILAAVRHEAMAVWEEKGAMSHG